MAKPGDFHVGVLDIFAIVLPGAVATALLVPQIEPHVFGVLVPAPQGKTEEWSAFLVVSYFLGHLIFLLGSYVDPLYSLLRDRFVPYGDTSAFAMATRIRDRFLDPTERKALNTFQWSRSVLIAIAPLAASDVHRIEADSKFFRSMLVVCLVATLDFASNGKPLQAAIAVAIMVPCFARYFERRLKTTRQAYFHVVSLYRLGKLESESSHAETESAGDREE